MIRTTRASVRLGLTNSGVEAFRSGEGRVGGHRFHRAVVTGLAWETVGDVGSASDIVVGTPRARNDGLSRERQSRAVVALGAVDGKDGRSKAVESRLADLAIRLALETRGETDGRVGARKTSRGSSRAVVTEGADATLLDAGDVNIRRRIGAIVTELAVVARGAVASDFTVGAVLSDGAERTLILRSVDGQVLRIVSTVGAEGRSGRPFGAELRSSAVEGSSVASGAVSTSRASLAARLADFVGEVASRARSGAQASSEAVRSTRADIGGVITLSRTSGAEVSSRARTITEGVVGTKSFAVVSSRAQGASTDVLGEASTVVGTSRARKTHGGSGTSKAVATNRAFTTIGRGRDGFSSWGSTSAVVTSEAETRRSDAAFGEAVVSSRAREALGSIDEASDVVVSASRAGEGEPVP